MLRRNGSICPYCELPMLADQGSNHPRAPSRDHVIPLSRGGPDHLENIVTCCRGCNEDKGKLTAEEYRAVLAGLASRLDHMQHPATLGPLTKSPRAWPSDSLHSRQTEILRWIESRGGKVDYR